MNTIQLTFDTLTNNNTVVSLNPKNDINQYRKNKKSTQCVESTKGIPVQPIKEFDTIVMIQRFLLHKEERYSTNKLRDFTFFILGCNTALRVSDLLKLTVKTLVNVDGSIKSEIRLKQKKTGVLNTYVIPTLVKQTLTMYFKEQPWLLNCLNTDEDFPLFFSRQYEVMTRQRAYQIMKEIETELSLDIHLGTHSLRKTMAYQIIKNNPNDQRVIANLMAILGHKSVTSLFHYLGIDIDEKKKLIGEGIGMDLISLLDN